MEPNALGRVPSAQTCGCSSTARAPAFQAGGAGSIPVTRSSPPSRNNVLKTPEKIVLGVAAALFAVGAAVAIAQPGDLGDDGAAPSEESTTTTAADTTTTTTAATTTSTSETTATTAGSSGATTTTTVGGDTTTTTAGSGIGSTDSGSVGTGDGIADTGMESLLGPGLALGALGLAVRRLARRRSA